MPGNNLIFYGTTGAAGAAHGNSQPNPALWLGKYRASQTLHSLQSTLTHNQTATSQHYVQDTARIGDGAQAHRFKWLLIQTGPGALSAARVESFDTATGIFQLDRRTNGIALIGNTYALFNRNNVWPDVSAAQAILGDTRYRCIFHRNQHGSAVTNVRYFLVPLLCGGADFARMSSQTGFLDISGTFLERANDTTDILNTLGKTAQLSAGFDDVGGWHSPFDRATALSSLDASLANNEGNPVWLRRIMPGGCTLRRSVAVLLVATTDVAASDPNPLVGACIMSYDVLGTPAAELELDRFPGVKGGCRLNGRIFEQSTGLPYPEQVRFDLVSGDVGELVVDGLPAELPDLYEEADEQGKAFATFRASDDSIAGDGVTPNMVLASGDEVGNPLPPLLLSFNGGLGLTSSADLFTTPNQQSYEDEQGAGFMPGI